MREKKKKAANFAMAKLHMANSFSFRMDKWNENYKTHTFASGCS